MEKGFTTGKTKDMVWFATTEVCEEYLNCSTLMAFSTISEEVAIENLKFKLIEHMEYLSKSLRCVLRYGATEAARKRDMQSFGHFGDE